MCCLSMPQCSFLFSVVSPYSFSIGNTSDMEPYLHGGIAVQVKTPKMFYFVSVFGKSRFFSVNSISIESRVQEII